MARRQPPAQGHDPSRREFFRTFSRQTVHNAGAVVGAAAELRRTSLAAARELLDLDQAPANDARALADVAPEPIELPEPAFRSAYRFTGDAVVVLDQRELPGRITTFECREPNEIAAAIRSGAITAGPILGQVGAYAVALAAVHAVDRSEAGREQLVRAAAGTMRAARRDVRTLTHALDRMEARFDDLVNSDASPTATADGLIAEAEAIAGEATLAHAQIGRLVAEHLLEHAAGEGPINVLAHGDAGPLVCGTVGTATAAYRSIIDAGRPLHVWLTEAAPSLEGTHISAYQLVQLDVPHTVIPDAAVGWLLANRTIDCVLLRGDAVAHSGDVAALIGARGVAELAAVAGRRVIVMAPLSALDADAGGAGSLVPEPRTAAGAGAAISGRLDPTVDLVPARLVGGLVSEESR